MTEINSIKLKTQFKEGYSLLTQAVRMYNEDEEQLSSGPLVLTARVFAKYFKGATMCTGNLDISDTHCISRTEKGEDGSISVTNRDYKYTNYARNTEYVNTSAFDDTQFYLMNNMLIIVDVNLRNGHQLISIDVNGKTAKPNAAGHDLFTFELQQSDKSGGYELVPSGAPNTFFENSAYCSRTGSDKYNGIGCAYHALQNEDYFKNLP